MSTETKDKLLDHNYDGIEEYDNPLPFWWVGLFWITIVFSAFYIVFYHFGPGPSNVMELQAGMNEIFELQGKELEKLGPVTDGTILNFAKDPNAMSAAKATFQSKCSPCHGMNGEGLIGPNLTDEYWIHGGRAKEIRKTISEGVPSKGMLTWKYQLGPVQIIHLAAYISTLKGTTPANPKAPEGTKVAPDWDFGAATDPAPVPKAPVKPGTPGPASKP